MTKAAELAKMGEVLTNNQIGGRRNILYNGSMICSQRGTSFTSLGGTAGVYSLDRMRFGFTMNSGRFTITQSTDTPNGFANSLKIDVTTAESSLNAASGCAIGQFIEGQDVQQFKKGTSDAEQYTLSFHVKSNVTGTYIVELFDFDNTRQVSKSYTIDSANTWEKKKLTFPADTSGAFDNDNDKSLAVQWFFASGTDRTSGTLNTSWASSTDANRIVGQTNLFSSTDNELYITGMQLEVGSTATPFEHRSFGEELALCQRYYHQSGYLATTHYGGGSAVAVAFNANESGGANNFPVTMRSAPTINIKNAAGTVGGVHRAGIGDVGATVAINWTSNADANTKGFGGFNKTSAWASGNVLIAGFQADAEL